MPQLLIIAVIVIMLFGTKRIRQAGGDFGAMIAGFRKETKGEKIDPLSVAKDVNKARRTLKEAKKLLDP